jgi:hypothetical protein
VRGAAGDEQSRDSARLGLAAGLALLCAGMAIAIAGVVVPGLFMPGVIVLGLGFVVLAVAAVLRLRAPQPADGRPAAARARTD